ncbi:hypothetical protein JHK82_052106 [Glycine max]|nr:hypothetical protein JHK82_052106 [Glycine max]
MERGRIKGVRPWWRRVMWEYKNNGVHKTIFLVLLQHVRYTNTALNPGPNQDVVLLLSSPESIRNPKPLIPNQSQVRIPNFNLFFLNVRRERVKVKGMLDAGPFGKKGFIVFC